MKWAVAGAVLLIIITAFGTAGSNQTSLSIIGGLGVTIRCINFEDRDVNVHWEIEFNGLLNDFSDMGTFVAYPNTIVSTHYHISGFGIIRAMATADGNTVERNGIVIWKFVIFMD